MLLGKVDFKIQRYVEEQIFEATEQFDYSQGFSVGARLTHEGPAKDIPPELGALRLYRKYYNETSPLTFTEIETRPCETKDFLFGPNDENPEAIFYPTIRTLADLEWFAEGAICVKNLDDIFGYGNFQTVTASVIMIVWERCDPEKNALSDATKDIKCANDTAYRNFTEGLYICSIDNQKRFVQHKFGEERLQHAAEINYYSLNNDDRSDFVKVINRGFLELNDKYVSFGDDDDGVLSFEISQKPTRSLPYRNKF